MADWKEYKLKDAIEQFIDYRGKTPPKTESGIPLITAKIVKDGRILEPNEFIATEDYQSWMTRGYPEINDVVLTTEAPLGEVALLKNKNVALAQRIITLRGKKGLCNNIFLKYYLQSNAGQFALQARASGSTVEGIKASELREVEIYLPPLHEQQAIAEVLSNLDDKIDLLHRQKKTIETLAETLFRQWFVEEAKESWETLTLDSFFPVITGKKDANYATDTGEYPFFTCSQKISFCEDFSFDGHAILLAGNGDFNLKRYKGRFEAYQRTYVLIPFEEKHIGFLFALMKYFLGEITSSAQGSVISFLTKGMITDYKIRLPENKELLNERLRIFNEFDEKVDFNLEQIRKLTKLRDTLLPKLMSGEVRAKIDESETAIASK